MPTPSWAAIVTAVATLFVAVAGLVGALTLFLPVLRLSRSNAKKIEEVKVQGAEIHTIVNQQRTDMNNYNRALIRALREKGIDVPVDQSVEPVKEKP
jgi:hypothetical protein